MICSYTVQKWLYNLEFENKKILKNIFINGHKQLNLIKDWN